MTLGVAAMEGRGFYYPVDTATGPNGRLYVLGRGHDGDQRGIQVCVMDVDSEYYGVFGTVGEADGQFIWPAGIAIDSEGQVFVSDEHLNRITVFDASGTLQATWGNPGSGPGELDGPNGLAVDADDRLLVVDHRNNRIQRFTTDGEPLASFGEKGDGPGQLNLPWGVAVASSGDIYVADWGNHRIQRFAADGEFRAAYGDPGDGDGQFHRPSSVAVDSDGFMYVADWGNERVQMLDPEGRFLDKSRGEATTSPWAQSFLDANVEEAQARSASDLDPDLAFLGGDVREESHHTQTYFWSPTSVKLDAEERLHVTDRNRHRIQVFQRS
jgi:sugar lactone lactonase YvrE